MDVTNYVTSDVTNHVTSDVTNHVTSDVSTWLWLGLVLLEGYIIYYCVLDRRSTTLVIKEIRVVCKEKIEEIQRDLGNVILDNQKTLNNLSKENIKLKKQITSFNANFNLESFHDDSLASMYNQLPSPQLQVGPQLRVGNGDQKKETLGKGYRKKQTRYWGRKKKDPSQMLDEKWWNHS